MKLNPKQILEGYRNSLFPKESLKELINTTSEERLNICRNCEQNSTPGKTGIISNCKSCGCFLIPKSKCLSCSCPLKKWEAVSDEETDDEISKIEGL